MRPIRPDEVLARAEGVPVRLTTRSLLSFERSAFVAEVVLTPSDLVVTWPEGAVQVAIDPSAPPRGTLRIVPGVPIVAGGHLEFHQRWGWGTSGVTLRLRLVEAEAWAERIAGIAEAAARREGG